jgi:hypothetical protein
VTWAILLNVILLQIGHPNTMQYAKVIALMKSPTVSCQSSYIDEQESKEEVRLSKAGFYLRFGRMKDRLFLAVI